MIGVNRVMKILNHQISKINEINHTFENSYSKKLVKNSLHNSSKIISSENLDANYLNCDDTGRNCIVGKDIVYGGFGEIVNTWKSDREDLRYDTRKQY